MPSELLVHLLLRLHLLLGRVVGVSPPLPLLGSLLRLGLDLLLFLQQLLGDLLLLTLEQLLQGADRRQLARLGRIKIEEEVLSVETQ